MLTLQEKIEADAAKRLPLPPHRQLAQELPRYQRFLKVETHRLKLLHRAGAGGREICLGRATVIDVLLRHLMVAVEQRASGRFHPRQVALTLVAIGGYGRGELNPSSDIDLMFLHNGRIRAHDGSRAALATLVNDVLCTLFDIGLKVGYSVRSLDDCVQVANTDMQSKTSLIEARLVVGEESLFQEMRRLVLGRCVRGFEDEYIAARLADQAARRAKYGNSALMQEPNVKNGCGGLRDFQNLLWMAYFKYRILSLAELEQRGQISATERAQLETAYDYLLRVRNDLHYHVGHAMDLLGKNVQPAIAHNLGFTDRSPMRRIERFMRVVYTHLRHIHLITRTLEQRLALLPPAEPRASLRALFRRRPAPPLVVEGFKIVHDELCAVSDEVFHEQPRRLMKVFLLAQQRGGRLHPDLIQLIRNHVELIDEAFLFDPHVRASFLEILNQRGNVAPVLRTMHEVGVLGRYLPEFGKLTCLVQHEFFHRYTADEHTLVCLEVLDRIWSARESPFNHYTELFQQTERPFVLYLALLLHDAGKASQARTHTDISVRLALRAARRLGLDPAATQVLRALVANHLAMIPLAQRRDLDDPAVARSFARQVRTPEILKLLTLHTFADAQGTSAELWNDFKESLLWTLYDRTLRVLVSAPEPVQAEARQREKLAQDLRKQLAGEFSEEEVKAHFQHLPPRYFRIHSAAQIAADLALVHRFLLHQHNEGLRGLEPIIAWEDEADRGYTSVRICTWDRAGLFSKIAGSLTAAGMNILSAAIFSRTDGVILDTFFVTAVRTGAFPNAEARAKFEHYLQTALTESLDLAALIAKLKSHRLPMPYLEGERLPTRLHFDHEISDSHTVLDLETEDRVGLLFTISRAISELGLDISTAKISTEKGAAFDSFYVSDAGQKILAPERRAAIERKLLAALATLDEGRPAKSAG